MRSLRENPPDEVEYESVGGFHSGSAGARCSVATEVALNRLVRRRTVPDMGFRALVFTVVSTSSTCMRTRSAWDAAPGPPRDE